MILTNLDMRAYSLYCEMEGYNKIEKYYIPLLSLDDFIYDKEIRQMNYKDKYYNLAKKELRKEKLNELQRINIH